MSFLSNIPNPLKTLKAVATAATLASKGASESTNKRISISDGTNNNRVALSFTTGSITAFVVSGGIASVANSLGISTPEEKHKIALAYKENDFVVYVDGVQVLVNTSGGVPVSMSEFKFFDGATHRKNHKYNVND